MTKKPDRWERIARKAAFVTKGPKVTYYMDPVDVAALLRKQHKWVERMVRQVSIDHPHSTLFRDSLLTKLKERAR